MQYAHRIPNYVAAKTFNDLPQENNVEREVLKLAGLMRHEFFFAFVVG